MTRKDVNIRKFYFGVFVVFFSIALAGFMFLVAYLNGTIH